MGLSLLTTLPYTARMSELLTPLSPAEFVRRRAKGSQALADQVTRDTLMYRAVVKPGARCAFIGSALYSVAQWVRHRVGDNATVMVFDHDLTLLEQDPDRRYEMCGHDLMEGPLPDAPYDLICFRGSVDSVFDPETVVGYLAQSLAPEGTMVGEVADWHTTLQGFTTAPNVIVALSAAIRTLGETSNYFPDLWSELPQFMLNAGLQSVLAESRARTINGGTAETDLFHVTLLRCADSMLQSGRLSQAVLESALESLADPAFRMMAPAQVSVWGRLPQAHPS